MSADGSAQRRLTSDGVDNSHPHWSPDGRRIVFNSSRSTPPADRANPDREQDDIFTIALDGSDLRQLTHCNTVCTYAFLSPDAILLAQAFTANGNIRHTTTKPA